MACLCPSNLDYALPRTRGNPDGPPVGMDRPPPGANRSGRCPILNRGRRGHEPATIDERREKSGTWRLQPEAYGRAIDDLHRVNRQQLSNLFGLRRRIEAAVDVEFHGPRRRTEFHPDR